MDNSDTNQVEQLNETAVKCRFFAQYFGLQVYHIGDSTIPFFFNENSFPITEKGHLKLKPLSKITDEDAISMYRGLGRNYESSNQFLEDYKSIGFLEQSEVDFLRSKCYAVPYMEYSVDELVKMGWVQLV